MSLNKLKQYNSLLLAPIILMAIVNQPVSALSGDSEQAVEIEANRMTLEETTGTSTYTGNVRLNQGSIAVTAHTLTVLTKNGRLQSMIILGNAGGPALFTQQTDSGETATGRAERIEYQADDSRLVLSGQAEMVQGTNRIKSERIVYNTQTNSLIAGAQPDGAPGKTTPPERVKIIIKPPKDNGSPNP